MKCLSASWKLEVKQLALPSRSYKGGSMAEVIDFEDLKKDSGDLKNLQDSDYKNLVTISKNY